MWASKLKSESESENFRGLLLQMRVRMAKDVAIAIGGCTCMYCCVWFLAYCLEPSLVSTGILPD